MPADQPRTRTVGCKMTDSEAERLTAVAEQDGQTLGEWVREVLLGNRLEELAGIGKDATSATCTSCGPNYRRLGPNSNSYVYERLVEAGLVPPPIKGAPGYKPWR